MNVYDGREEGQGKSEVHTYGEIRVEAVEILGSVWDDVEEGGNLV
jgi:hypothetical protein